MTASIPLFGLLECRSLIKMSRSISAKCLELRRMRSHWSHISITVFYDHGYHDEGINSEAGRLDVSFFGP